MQLDSKDIVYFNLILALAKCQSELIHNIPSDKIRMGLKQAHKRYFSATKELEAQLDKFTKDLPDSKAQIDFVYDQYMETIYKIEEMATNNLKEKE